MEEELKQVKEIFGLSLFRWGNIFVEDEKTRILIIEKDKEGFYKVYSDIDCKSGIGKKTKDFNKILEVLKAIKKFEEE